MTDVTWELGGTPAAGATEVRIANLALMRVGVTHLIDSLDEATTEARACKAAYVPARDEVLTSHRWTFATRRAQLAAVAGAEVKGWRGVFALPSDYLQDIDLWAGMRTPSASQRARYGIEHGPEGQVLLTDEEAPELRYVARVSNALRYPPLFVEAMAWRLACDLVLALPVKPQLGPMCFDRYRMALSSAIAADLRAGQEDEPPESEFIRVRG